MIVYDKGGQITLLFVRTREFRVKKVVNNNRQLYDGLLTYYIKSSFLKLSQFTNCTFLDIEWTRPGSLANPSVSLLSHRRSLSTQHHTLVSKINGRGGANNLCDLCANQSGRGNPAVSVRSLIYCKVKMPRKEPQREKEIEKKVEQSNLFI